MVGQHQDGAAGAVSAVQLQALSCRVFFVALSDVII